MKHGVCIYHQLGNITVKQYIIEELEIPKRTFILYFTIGSAPQQQVARLSFEATTICLLIYKLLEGRQEATILTFYL